MYAHVFLSGVLAMLLGAAEEASSPVPEPSSTPSLAEVGSWIAGHLPSRYDEVLAGTTNTIAARYSASGCKIAVSFDYSTDFNSARNADRSAAWSVKGNSTHGHHFDGSDSGGTIDFALVDPSSLHIADATEYLGSEEVTPGSFEFTFRNEADAKAMLDAMTAFAKACAS